MPAPTGAALAQTEEHPELCPSTSVAETTSPLLSAAYDRATRRRGMPRQAPPTAGRHVPVRGRVPTKPGGHRCGRVRPSRLSRAILQRLVEAGFLSGHQDRAVPRHLSAAPAAGAVPMKARREKVFGPGRAVPLDRNAKARIAAYARAWSADNRQPGQRGGALARAVLDVLEALLWGFHNSRLRLLLPELRDDRRQGGCARSTVAEAIKALEWAGVLTWQNRITRPCAQRDLFGRWSTAGGDPHVQRLRVPGP